MTQQDDITQRVLTDDEIMRSAISACDSLNITRFHEIGAPSKTIMDDAGLLELGRAIESALLSKLRAPVADERDRNATISQIVGLCNRIPGSTTWNAAQFMYDEMHRRAALASAPVIVEREAFTALSDLVNALRERHYGRMPEEVQQAYDRAWTIVFTAPDAVLASAPVAGEVVAWRVTHPRSPKPGWEDAARELPPTLEHVKQQDPDLVLELAYAAPQASAENVRNAALEQAAAICDSVDNHANPMTARDCADAIRALKIQADRDGPWCCERGEAQGVKVCQECAEISAGYQASMRGDKDGGQQRAGDECKHARAYRAGDRQGYACPDCGEFVSDYEIHRRKRAALSAPQAEQGERDAG